MTGSSINRNLTKDIEEARHKAFQFNYSEKIEIGQVNSYHPDELMENDAKIIVRGRILYLVECKLKVHDLAVSIFGHHLADQLNSSSVKLIKENFRQVGKVPFPGFVNKTDYYTNGLGKVPDGSMTLITRAKSRRVSESIVIEVAFRNMSFNDLLLEGSSWVNEFSDTEFCFLVWIKERDDTSDVEKFCLLVMQRIFPSQSGKEVEVPRSEWSFPADQVTLETPNDALEKQLGIKIIHRQDITRKGLAYGEKIVVNLPTKGLQAYFGGAQIFAKDEIEIDLTAAFKEIFSEIDHIVTTGTYPLKEQ